MPNFPKDAGLTKVKLKRKIEYKNIHKEQFVDVEKILSALKYLKEINNPIYEDILINEDIETECQNEDPKGYEDFFKGNENVQSENGVEEDESDYEEEYKKYEENQNYLQKIFNM